MAIQLQWIYKLVNLEYVPFYIQIGQSRICGSSGHSTTRDKEIAKFWFCYLCGGCAGHSTTRDIVVGSKNCSLCVVGRGHTSTRDKEIVKLRFCYLCGGCAGHKTTSDIVVRQLRIVLCGGGYTTTRDKEIVKSLLFVSWFCWPYNYQGYRNMIMQNLFFVWWWPYVYQEYRNG